MKWPHLHSSSFRYKDFSKFLIFFKIFQKKLIFGILAIFWKIMKFRLSVKTRRFPRLNHGCVETFPEVFLNIFHLHHMMFWALQSDLRKIEISWFFDFLADFCENAEMQIRATDLQLRNGTSKCFSEAAICPIRLRSKYDGPETFGNTIHIRWSTSATGGARISPKGQNYL